MRMPRSLGAISLTVVALGYACVEAMIRVGWVEGPFWRVLADAFEAGTVGGVADWFAVSALFREVPIPLLRRHTNIIVRNRARIVDGIADMVQNRWLSPAVIREHLEKVAPSDHLVALLGDARKQARLVDFIRELLGKSARGIDGPEFSGFLERAFREQIEGLELHRHLGSWLGDAVRRGDHHRVWELLLASIDRSLDSPEVERALHRVLEEAIGSYKETGFLRRAAIDTAEFLGLIDSGTAIDSILSNVKTCIGEAQGNAAHPVRQRLDAMLLDFAERLRTGDPDTLAAVDSLKRRLADDGRAGEIVRTVLSRLVETLRGQLESPDSDLSKSILRFVDERLIEFRNDPASRERFDRWVRSTAAELVESRHDAIGEMVRGSLAKLNDQDLVAQIEEKVGPDLQYIRLNGAVVGAAVGAVLSVVRMAFNG